MGPRFLGRLGAADAVTTANAAVGFVAAVVALEDPDLAARLVLVGAIADGVDGVVARRRGSTPAGEYIDSLADVATFGVAPAAIVVGVATADGGLDAPLGLAAVGAGALFVAMGVVRLALYTAHDAGDDETEGVQTTLAATILAAIVLAGYGDPRLLVVVTAVLAGMMVTTITYPDLHAQDAVVMGAVQAIAALLPGDAGRVFAFALLTLSAAYLTLGPRFYWRDGLESFGS